MPTPDDWATASDLAEYAYCPRALAYRRADPDAPATGAQRRGTAYHAGALGRERWRADHPFVLWAGLALGLGLTIVGGIAAVRP